MSAFAGNARRQAAPLANGNMAGGQQQATPVQQEQKKAVAQAELPQKPFAQSQPFIQPQSTGLQQQQHVQQPPAPQVSQRTPDCQMPLRPSLCVHARQLDL